jgi:hypothetical protein
MIRIPRPAIAGRLTLAAERPHLLHNRSTIRQMIVEH